MKKQYILLISSLNLIVMSCASIKVPLSSNYNTYRIEMPSAKYSIGQILEFNGYSKGIDIIYDPRIPVDQSLVIETEVDKQIRDEVLRKMENKIKEVINQNIAKLGEERIQLEVSAIKTRQINKYDLFMNIESDIKRNPDLYKMLSGYTDAGIRFNVIHQIKTAQLGLSVFEASGKVIILDQEVIKAISNKIGIQFIPDGEKGKYISQNVVIEIGYDTKMIEAIAHNHE